MRGWIVGSDGVYRGEADGGWKRVGRFGYGINCLIHWGAGFAAGCPNGVYEVDAATGAWRQMHDETVTEVLAAAAVDGDPGIAVACPLGVATARRRKRPADGSLAWDFRSAGLPLNERYGNALAADPRVPGRFLSGSEAGVLSWTEGGARRERTGLAGFPVRALLASGGEFWAGTDEHGVWRSADGLTWRRAGRGADDATVFALASCGDGAERRLLCGTMEGLFVGDGEGRWERTGPSLSVTAAAADPAGGTWAMGGSPGGLWFSADRGGAWKQSGPFLNVGALLAPEAAGNTALGGKA